MIDKVRELALKVLYKIDKEEAYSNIALNEILNANREKLTPKDIGLISEIIYGVTTINIRCNNNKTFKNKNEKNINMGSKHFKNGNISNIIFRQNTTISCSK